ncbi:MAG: SDR family NAD(P)-dependent oxidoreductase, partial [Anaerolineae bacterium]|nr:SDR family NAD(P)-dependent oxidoreductase [Anaerolineae bacterium]
LAYAFARRAAKIVLVARREDRLEAVRREIEPYSSAVLVIPADLSDDEQLQSVITRTRETFGRIDILVNNAGSMPVGPLQEQDSSAVRRMVDVNLTATIRLTQLALPHMLANQHGYILNIGSGLGRTAMPLFSAYSATKYGVSGFSDALRRELSGTGVYVTLVLPTWTHTELLTPSQEDIVKRYGYQVQDADAVAERAVLALVRGEREIILGGPGEWIGILMERYIPFLVRLYWKLWLTPEWIATMRTDNYTDTN